jgi:predicted Zn-dependent protease
VLGLFLQQNPQNVSAQIMAANSYLLAKQWPQAIAHYEAVRKRIGNGDATLLNNLAWAYSQAGDFDRALPARPPGLGAGAEQSRHRRHARLAAVQERQGPGEGSGLARAGRPRRADRRGHTRAFAERSGRVIFLIPPRIFRGRGTMRSMVEGPS